MAVHLYNFLVWPTQNPRLLCLLSFLSDKSTHTHTIVLIWTDPCMSLSHSCKLSHSLLKCILFISDTRWHALTHIHTRTHCHARALYRYHFSEVCICLPLFLFYLKTQLHVLWTGDWGITLHVFFMCVCGRSLWISVFCEVLIQFTRQYQCQKYAQGYQ